MLRRAGLVVLVDGRTNLAWERNTVARAERAVRYRGEGDGEGAI